MWWQHVLGYEYGDNINQTREGLSEAQYDEVQAMIRNLDYDGRCNMQVGLIPYIGMVLGDLAVLFREAAMANTERRPAEERTVPDDEVLVEVHTDEDTEAEEHRDRGERHRRRQHRRSTVTEETSLMQTSIGGKTPHRDGDTSQVFGMLLETFTAALHKYHEVERRRISAWLLGHLRSSSRQRWWCTRRVR